MQAEQLLDAWRREEEIAHIHGWNFSYIEGRFWEETDFPWDYRSVLMEYMDPNKKILDLDTGGGEFLLSLGHPFEKTSATEGYGPNVELCKQTLIPKGIDFRPADSGGALPFADCSQDLVINRHADMNPMEIFRVLKPGGVFITQQVGAENDRELVELLCGDLPMPFPEQYPQSIAEQFRETGFEIQDVQECYRRLTFYDVGALVWFARVIPWEFIDFSVDTARERLLKAQEIVEREGCVFGRTHRFLLIARKPI